MTKVRGRVFLVDDDDSVRTGLSRLLRANGYQVEAFACGRAFLESGVLQDGPACLVLDIRMPESNGLDLQRELLGLDDQPGVVFVTGHGNIPLSVRAIKAGAVNFLSKPVGESELLAAVEEALASSAKNSAARNELRVLQNRLAALTPREHEVMVRVVAGRLNKQIAAELGTSEKTIKVHRARVMEKLQAASLADLVRAAEKLGIRGTS